jgi:hypothetical protein
VHLIIQLRLWLIWQDGVAIQSLCKNPGEEPGPLQQIIIIDRREYKILAMLMVSVPMDIDGPASTRRYRLHYLRRMFSFYISRCTKITKRLLMR